MEVIFPTIFINITFIRYKYLTIGKHFLYFIIILTIVRNVSLKSNVNASKILSIKAKECEFYHNRFVNYYGTNPIKSAY